MAEGKHETVLASEFEKFSPTEILKHVDWSKTEGTYTVVVHALCVTVHICV